MPVLLLGLMVLWLWLRLLRRLWLVVGLRVMLSL